MQSTYVNGGFLKKATILSAILLVIGLSMPQIIHAQGITYLSNLEQSPSSNYSAGSNSWLAAVFQTGDNPGGYTLNSIQLGMADASGDPDNVTVLMVMFSPHNFGPTLFGNAYDTFSGSLDPVAGVFDYIPAAPTSITLLPQTAYYIVLTAGVADANGWDYVNASSYNLADGWMVGGVAFPSAMYSSVDGYGFTWNTISGAYPQFAIDATAVPEPSPSWLLLAGLGFLIYTPSAIISIKANGVATLNFNAK